MKYCPITLELINDNEEYSLNAFKHFSRNLDTINPLPYSAEDLRKESLIRMDKMSIQGVQQKLSAIFSIKKKSFEICDVGGTFILKPPSLLYTELPENEALTMSLAKIIGLDVSFHGLVRNHDDTFTYFIKRFDRASKNKKFAVEDLAQLSYSNRKTKYRSSMEKVAEIVLDNTIISFPVLEAVNLFKLVLFNYLIGNEDAHLKNFSVITIDNKVRLSPVYDLVNTTIALQKVKEEIALPINDKKNNLTSKDFIQYFASERLHLNEKVIDKILRLFKNNISKWRSVINISYLSSEMKHAYLDVLNERCEKVKLI